MGAVLTWPVRRHLDPLELPESAGTVAQGPHPVMAKEDALQADAGRVPVVGSGHRRHEIQSSRIPGDNWRSDGGCSGGEGLGS